jgi:hypothetical protein
VFPFHFLNSQLVLSQIGNHIFSGAQVASDYIEENIKTLETVKAGVVRRALGICRIADALAEHALPSRRAAIISDITEVCILSS